MRYFYERSGGDGQHFVAVTDPGSPLVDLARERGFRRVFENDPDIGGRYSVLSYFGLVPAALMGVNVEALLHRAQVAEQNCTHFDDDRLQLRPLARRRDGRAGAAGPRQGDVRGVRADLELRPLGRAADRGVDRQAGQGHPAGGRRAARRPGRLRRRPRVRLPARPRQRRPGARREGGGAGAAPGHPIGHARRARRRRPRPDLLLRRVRHRGGGLGARHQPVRPAQRAGGEGQHRRRCSKEGLPELPPGDLADRARRPRRRTTWRSLGYVDAVGRVRRGGRRAAGEDPRPDQGDHDVRLRPALPALDRPVPQGRPAERRVPPALRTTARRTSRSRRPATPSST